MTPLSTLKFSLFHAEFVDAIREGDRERVIRCWRFLLALFKSAARVNYSKEALNLLTQLVVLSPRQSHQLMWSRFVNIHGWTGHNVSCDIHMEHLNRTCKTAVRLLGANLTPKAITRVGKCLGSITMVTQQLDKLTGVYRPYGTHSKASVNKDIKVVEELVSTARVFEFTPGRKHSSFSSLSHDFFLGLDITKLLEWMKTHVK